MRALARFGRMPRGAPLLVTCLVAVVFWVHLPKVENADFADVIHNYHPAARALLHQGIGAYLASAEALRLAPVPVAILAAAGGDTLMVKYLNLALFALTALPLAAIGQKIAGPFGAVCVALAWAVAPTTPFYAIQAMPEGPFFFLFSCALWFFIRFCQRGSWFVPLSLCSPWDTFPASLVAESLR